MPLTYIVLVGSSLLYALWFVITLVLIIVDLMWSVHNTFMGTWCARCLFASYYSIYTIIGAMNDSTNHQDRANMTKL